MSTVTMKPIGDKLVIKPIQAEEKSGRFFIPDVAKEKPQEGVVMFIGDGSVDRMKLELEVGHAKAYPIKVGDRVLVTKYGGTDIQIKGEVFKIANMDDVLVVLEEKQ